MDSPMNKSRMIFVLMALVVMGSAMAAAETQPELAVQVRAAETAFAKTMADRDVEAFASFLAADAIFLDGGQTLRGREAVKAAWSAYYTGPTAPFSWEPAVVEVLASGTLAHSSGPVLLPDGREVATFNSIWQRQANGSWKVVFDKGCNKCN